jgi:hypothetical protein
LTLDPNIITLREWLIRVYERRGEPAKAEPHKQLLQRIKNAMRLNR